MEDGFKFFDLLAIFELYYIILLHTTYVLKFSFVKLILSSGFLRRAQLFDGIFYKWVEK